MTTIYALMGERKRPADGRCPGRSGATKRCEPPKRRFILPQPHDVTLMFKMLVLQALYNLSDDQTEFRVRDRASFQRFLGLSPEDTVPDAKTLWLFRERLVRHGLIDTLFQRFDEQLWASGLMPKGGQIVDASLINVPKNRNTRDENKQIKEGKTPEGWDDKPNMKRQKDEERPLDEETRQEPLRVQEPHQR